MYLFVTNIFVFFILVLLKQFKFDIVLAKKTGGKMLHCLTHPSCNLYKINLWKKVLWDHLFSLLSCILYFKFPTLALPPLNAHPYTIQMTPLRTFRRNQNAKFKICEWKNEMTMIKWWLQKKTWKEKQTQQIELHISL